MRPNLQDIIEGIDTSTAECQFLLNTKTGEVALVTDDEMRASVHVEKLSDSPEWYRKNVEEALRVRTSGDYISLPTKFEFNEYQVMKSFCLSLPNHDTKEEMYYSIKGKGAFSRFRQALHRCDLTQDWYRYRDDALREFAIKWCHKHHIDFEDSVQS